MTRRQLAFGPFVFDADRGTLTRDGVAVAVGGRGLALLYELLKAEGRPVGKDALIEAAWPGMIVEDSNLSVQIAALRKVLGPAPQGGGWIATVARVGYRFVGAEIPHEIAGAAPSVAEAGRSVKPVIAVLPFINVSGDKGQEYLADGISEDIITALARFRWFFVIARNTSFTYKGRSVDAKQIAGELGVSYLLEGSVRKSGKRCRISAQLVDARSGVHIWAERYNLAIDDVFAIEDEIAERVAGAIEPELLKVESAPEASRHTGNMTAWDLVRQGTWRFHKVARSTHFEARELFREACRLDPDLPEAHIWLARVCAGLIAYGWSDDPAADRQEGVRAALTAVQLDGKNPYSHYAVAIISAYSDTLDQAIRAAETATGLSPSFALGHLVLGMVRLFSGRAPEAVAPLERGLELNPHDPQNPVWFNLLALARLFAGDADGALKTALRALGVRPDWRPLVETLICCYGALDRWDEARAAARRIAAMPAPTGDALAPLRAGNPEWRDRMQELLQRASENE